MNTYIDGMMDAAVPPSSSECKEVLRSCSRRRATSSTPSPRVSGSVTVSTLHGCPPDEIERIASYLISEKSTCTPSSNATPPFWAMRLPSSILDAMGYDYIVFDEHHFNEDLQWADAVPMFQRLQKLADSCGLEFGLKLSNTFPVDTTRGELPSKEMYMSGRSLFP